MPANGTNQSLLSEHTRPTYDNPMNNQRAQAYTNNRSPNTPYNQGANNAMFSQYNPSYGYGQQASLGRYTPPMMNFNDRGFGNQYSWMNQGGYGYNTPEAYTAYPGMGQQQGMGTSGFFDYLRNMFGQQGQQMGPANRSLNRGGGFGAFLEQQGGGFGNRGGGFGPQPTMPGAAETMRGGGFGPRPESITPVQSGPTMMGGQSIGGATRPPQGGANSPWMSNTPQQSTPQQIFGALPWLGGTPYQQVPGG